VEQSKVVVIIPAYNEAETIAKVVEDVLVFTRVIVVDDFSTDDTCRLAEDAGAWVVKHTANKGYAGALNSGFEKAASEDFEMAITFDADGQHSSKMIPLFTDLLEGDYDLVLGVRPKKARLGEWIFGLLTNMLYKVEDPLCGMKGYNLRLFRQRGYFDSSNSIGTELAIWAIRNKYAFKQIAIPICERKDNPRFGQVFQANLKILRAIMNLFLRFNK
jgi:glycosyltransferase involved in cell wall biosynthesis